MFFNTTGASYPFLRRLAVKGERRADRTDNGRTAVEPCSESSSSRRSTILAADSIATTRFRCGSVHLRERRRAACVSKQKGQLPTERPRSTTPAGDRTRGAESRSDGAVARFTYLEQDVGARAPSDTALAGLMRRRADLETQLES